MEGSGAPGIPGVSGEVNLPHRARGVEVSSIGDGIDHRRVALFFSDSDSGSLNNYERFLKQCDFKVTVHPVQSVSGDRIDFRLGQSVQQVIVVVQCTNRDACSLDEVLNFLNEILTDRVDKFLLFCRIRDVTKEGEAVQEDGRLIQADEAVAARFSTNWSTIYKNVIVGYIVDDLQCIDKLLATLVDAKRRMWKEDCISTILQNLQLPPEATLYLKSPNNQRKFRQDIIYQCIAADQIDPEFAQRAEQFKNTFIRQVDPGLPDEYIYSNRRQRTADNGGAKNPRALIVSNVNMTDDSRASQIGSQDLQINQMSADLHYLMQTFKALDYDVKDVQTLTTASGSGNLERHVEEYANDNDHGDSCVLIVLTESGLSGTCIHAVCKSMAYGKVIRAKPRLVIFQEWVPTERRKRTNADALPQNLILNLPDVLNALQDQWTVWESAEEVHPQSGMVFCHSKVVTQVSRVNGVSPFVKSLCETFIALGQTMDLVSMITKINSNLDDVPSWSVQTTKYFYITDTGNIKERRVCNEDDAVLPPANESSCEPRPSCEPSAANQEPPASDTDNDSDTDSDTEHLTRTGVAIVLSERWLDDLRNYQIFLEYAGFEVYSELITAEVAIINEFVESHVDKEALNVVIIVRDYGQDNTIEEIISKIEALSLQKKSFLLIYLEIYHGDVFEPLELKQRRPKADSHTHEAMTNGRVSLVQKLCSCCYDNNWYQQIQNETEEPFEENASEPNNLSVAFRRGTISDVENCLRMLLNRPRDNLMESCIVGYDFAAVSDPGAEFSYKSWDNRSEPDWRVKVFLPKYYRDKTNGSFQEKLSDFRGKSCGLSSGQAAFDASKKRALIIHNVIFENQTARFGSLCDCQTLVDTLSVLQFRVTVRSNLSAERLLKEVKLFSAAQDHKESCMIVVMSHGCLGEICGADGKFVKEKEIFQSVDESQSLKGKMKLILFQACRTAKTLDLQVDSVYQLNYADLIVAHSTSPLDYSFQCISRGSRFIQCLCETLRQSAEKGNGVTLSLITTVNYTMMCFKGKNKYIQQPWWLIGIRKEFILFDGQRQTIDTGAACNSSGINP